MTTHPSSSDHANGDYLRLGVGRADITPPLGTPLTGYPDPYNERCAETVRDPLHVTAMWLAQGAQRFVLLNIDVAVIDDPYMQRMRDGVSEATGVAPDHVLVCATHSHSTPRTHVTWGWGEPNADFIDRQMIPGAVEAARRAAAEPAPVRVGIGTCESAVGINRRALNDQHQAQLGQCAWGLTDPTMTVLRFEGAQGPVASLVHYGAHPTVFGKWSRAVSRDWPGVMIDRVEQISGAPALFINGALGDVAPRTSSGSATGENEAALWEAGGLAALDAVRTWRGIRDFRDVSLDGWVESFELPYDPLPARDEAERQFEAAKANKDQPGRGMCEYMHWRAVLEAHDEPARSGKSFQQTLLALGPVAIVPFPGEPFTELILRLRDASPFAYTLGASLSCGHNGYLCAQSALCRGGYEPWVGRAFGARLLAAHVDDVLVSENARLLGRLHQRMQPALPAR